MAHGAGRGRGPSPRDRILCASLARRLVLALALLSLASGCAALNRPIPPVYTDEELRDKCLRTGGWWRGDLIAGYCEYQSPGFL